ncbi:LysR substrate-binding domain-containing protein [Arboricoccus pini]|nr:LysR substrate-binding domain-containing protein [Arboricoccus pini]
MKPTSPAGPVAGRLPSLTALRVFEAAARLGGIARAAQSLHVTQSAASRQITALEAELQLCLFKRVHRGVVLTADGQALAATLTRSFGQISQAVDRLRADRGTVRLCVLPTIGIRWLWPRLHRFEERHPSIRLKADILWNAFEPDDLDHDLGIRCGRGAWPGSRAVIRLLGEYLTPVCSPDFLKNHRLPKTAAEFAAAPLLHNDPDHQDWRVWAEGWGGPIFDVAHGQVFDMLDMAVRAASFGRGIAMADLGMVAAELAEGTLIAPYQAVVRSPESYYIVERRGVSARTEVETVRAWLLEEAAAAGAGIQA